MRKTTKIWLLAAACLVLAGGILWGGVMCVLRWDLTKLSTARFATNKHQISGEFRNISVETDTADIVFARSEDGKCTVECYEEEKAKHSVTVAEDTLVIRLVDEKAWYERIGISFGSPKLTVYLPEGFALESVNISLSTGDVDFSASASKQIKIKTSTGRICVENVSAGALELSASTGAITVSDAKCEGDVSVCVSTGKTVLRNVSCANLTSRGSTGDLSMQNVIAAEAFSVTRSTGDVKMENSDASDILVETDTGDVVGSLLSGKVFVTKTDTGRVSVPDSMTGGRCEITTSTGNIRIEIIRS